MVHEIEISVSQSAPTEDTFSVKIQNFASLYILGKVVARIYQGRDYERPRMLCAVCISQPQVSLWVEWSPGKDTDVLGTHNVALFGKRAFKETTKLK